LSIGCVLVTLPSVLVLDEPTSGLDAFTSQLLLRSLSSLAKTHNRTIILSLHAPRSDAFPLFDKLLLLSKGSLVYAGSGSASLPWFSSLGWNVEKGVNPLDFLIDVSSVDNRDVDAEEASRERVDRLVKAWKESEESGREKQFMAVEGGGWERRRERAAVLAMDTSHQGLDELETRDPRRPGLMRQTAVLLRRSHLNVYRNYGQLIGFAVQAIVIGVLLGFTFFQLGETLADVQSLKK
jgi:ABC-type multidrug transport system ATPase subunit